MSPAVKLLNVVVAEGLGRSDADLYTPREHACGLTPTDREAAAGLEAVGLVATKGTVRAWRRGFREHGRFLVAAACVGAVDYASGGVQ